MSGLVVRAEPGLVRGHAAHIEYCDMCTRRVDLRRTSLSDLTGFGLCCPSCARQALTETRNHLRLRRARRAEYLRARQGRGLA